MPRKSKLTKGKKVPARKNQTSFKPGVALQKGVANRKGLAAYDADELATRTIDKQMVSRYLMVNSHLTKDQIKARLATGQVSMLESMVMRTMLRCYYSGEVGILDFFLDRIVGKVPNKVEHTKADPYEGKTLEELQAEKLRLEAINRKTLSFIEQTERYKQQERDVIEIASHRNAPAPNEGGDNTGT